MIANLLIYFVGCIDSYPVSPNQQFVERHDEDFDKDAIIEKILMWV